MISRAQIGQILKVYKAQGIASPLSKAEGVSSGSTLKDDINLSFSPSDLTRVRELVQKLPDVRLDKVESIAREIEAGTYKVDSMQVADKMMGRLLADKLK
ncbi:MAG: flagellar biosynthesis anti-sigma factor FlgM [Bacillota bacterium]